MIASWALDCRQEVVGRTHLHGGRLNETTCRGRNDNIGAGAEFELETGVSPAPDGESSLARDIFANYWTFVGASASAALI